MLRANCLRMRRFRGCKDFDQIQVLVISIDAHSGLLHQVTMVGGEACLQE